MSEKKRAGGKKSRRHFPRILIFLLVVVLLIAGTHLFFYLSPMPELDAFLNQQYSTRFYDRKGILLHIMPLEGGVRKEYRTLDEYPEYLKKKFIEEEDSHFYYHPGVDFLSVIRAAKQNKDAGKVVSGASTITMQLVRLIFPRTGDVSMRTKIDEMFLAFKIEAKLSKKQILELYLNNIPFGNLADGVASAARTFYEKTPDQLTNDEIDVLAKIPRRPSEYAPPKSCDYNTRCNHFILYAIKNLKETYGVIPPEIYLSIDCELTEKSESLVQLQLSEHQSARIHNGAAFVINNKTGEIIVWCGDASFKNEHAGQIDGVLALNQPGSSMKPLLYAHALENGFYPSAILPDIQMDFGASGVYIPNNFNNRFNGPVSMRYSLASSLNVPAVYLLHEVGIDTYFSRLMDLGYESLSKSRESLGLSLALGAGEVSLYEMVRAFSVFPNDGRLTSVFFEKQEKNPEPMQKKKRIFDPDTTRVICDMLSDKSARALGFGNAKVFDTPYPSIFKTGTSNQFQNIIALGATSEYTAGVWMGNHEGETVVKQTGSSIPARVVRNLLDTLTKETDAKEFLQPEKYEKREICALSGMKPGPSCPAVMKEFVPKISNENADFEKTCSWHRMKRGTVVILYPELYRHWASNKNFHGTISSEGDRLQIMTPKNNSVFVLDPLMPAEVQKIHVMALGGQHGGAQLFVDGDHFYGFSDSLTWDVPLMRGAHTLTVVSGDESHTISYTVQ
ncbi:MAG: transglycosylase domain-containing protein [Treponema sp.]|nr:transglycosylase domain-containing protein [Treponema sp.]